jgi:hypothetical protein
MDTTPAVTPATAPAPAAEPLRLLSRDEILSAQDTKYDTVPVDEWSKGASVRVRSLPAVLRDFMEAQILEAREKSKESAVAVPTNVRAIVVAFCVVDAEGRQLFTPNDIEALGQKNVRPIQRIYDKALELNAITDADISKLAGNSDGEASDISSSPSP